MEISVGSVHTIIRSRLGMRKVSACLVPRRLTSDLAESRLELATANLSQFNTEDENFLSRIVAIDETWVRSYELELKRQSIEWQSGKLQAHRGLQSLCEYKSEDAYDLCIRYSGCSHGVPTGKRVNGEYYNEYIQKYLRPAI